VLIHWNIKQIKKQMATYVHYFSYSRCRVAKLTQIYITASCVDLN